jgi:photosystem II stability/assembly factor-like uncharacterized protein
MTSSWKALVCSLSLLGGSALSGCTFYTSCPTGGNNNNNQGTAGTSGMMMVDPGHPIVDGKFPKGDWQNVTPTLPPDLKDMCGPIFFLSSYPTHDEIIAGVFSQLWSTTDGGQNWARIGEGKDSMPPNNRAQQIIYDPTDEKTYWEAGIYGDGVFRTNDSGDTFKWLGNSTHIDAISIDMTDPMRQTMLSSGHEQQLVQKSVDGGDTWKDISAAIPQGSKWCRNSIIIDANTYLLGCGGGFNMMGSPTTLRSEDGGGSWTKVYDDGGGGIPLITADGSIYWPSEAGHGLALSTDQGKTFAAKPQAALQPMTPVELPDGRIAAVTDNHIVLSDDKAVTWKNVSPATPWIPNGFIYSTFQKAFFIFFFRCGSVSQGSLGNEIYRFDFDYEKY